MRGMHRGLREHIGRTHCGFLMAHWKIEGNSDDGREVIW